MVHLTFAHMKKKTLVMGASTNPARYSNMATRLLRKHDHPVLAFGLKKGEIEDVHITQVLPADEDIDTVTLYLGPQNQIPYVDYIIKLNPKRVVFNPGTENAAFQEKLHEHGVEAIEACTLVMLNTQQF